MATGYKYKDKDIVELTAKYKGETLTGVTSINPKNSDYKSSYSGEYRFIPYSTSILDGVWASKRVEYKDVYTSESSNTVKIENAAAWGSAPIPKRKGLNNTDSQYISTKDHAFDRAQPDILEWKDNQIVLTNSVFKYENDTAMVITSAPCVVIDVVARGGNGGKGYRGSALSLNASYNAGGGGGGAGGHASLLIDMSVAKKIIFDNTTDNLTVKAFDNTIFLKLTKGGDGSASNGGGPGKGGVGGTVENPDGWLPDGVSILWTCTGPGRIPEKEGEDLAGYYGDGAGGSATSGGGTSSLSAPSPNQIRFITADTVDIFPGGSNTTANDCWAGGGGAASMFAAGGNGAYITTDGTLRPNVNGNYGSGGGGDYSHDNDERGTSGRNGGIGGGAFARFYFESTCTDSFVITPGGGSGGLTCVFPGTQIALDKDTSIDIVDFVGRTPIDFCNPDTLEHFPQQTLARLYSSRATKKITIWLEDGKTVSLTPDHAILTKEGFKTYTSTVNMFPLYTVGDTVATVDGYKKIISLQDENIDASKVYNIITENSLMVANGIIIAGELNYAIDPTAVINPDISKDHWGNDSGGGGGLLP